LNRDEKIQLLMLNEQKKVIRARRSLLDFTTYTFPKYKVNWHHGLMANELDKLVRGETKRLIIQAPPRHGKSELVSRRLPAFYFGHNPSHHIISASYSDTLSSKMNRDTQRVMDTPEYLRVFPGTFIPRKGFAPPDGRNYMRNSEEFEIIGTGGRYKSAGVGTGITGMGFHLGLIDDPFKDRKDADSPTIRRNVWDWYTSTFSTRAEDNAAILITMTRWHESDLCGKLIQLAKDGKGDIWVILTLPAIYDDSLDVHPDDPRSKGDALWPEKYDLDRLKTIRENSSRDWAALFQQTPVVDGGGIFKKIWWKFYDEPPKRFDEVIQSWDFAFKGNTDSDYVVGQVWGRVSGDKYLLDQHRAKLTFTESVKAIQHMSAKWPQTYRKLVEDKANGTAIIDTLKRAITGIIPVNPDGSKEARAYAVSPQVESGNVYLPKNAPWVHDYIHEHSVFPNGKNDDQVDCTTQALRQLGGSAIENLEKLLQL
jgi:predicted phage terminase large subunit-like protein